MNTGRSLRRAVTGALVGGATLVAIASAGWGCVAMATLELMPSAVEPGQRVEFRGSYYHDAAPVVLRWDAVDGPAVATVSPAELIDFGHAYWRTISGGFTVPGDTPPGAHVLVATQEASPGRPTWGVPARAVLQVGGDGAAEEQGPAEVPVARLSALQVESEKGPEALPVAAVAIASALTAAAGAGVVTRRKDRRRVGPRST